MLTSFQSLTTFYGKKAVDFLPSPAMGLALATQLVVAALDNEFMCVIGS